MFVTRVLKNAGANEAESLQMGEVLAHADYRGHFSHGLNRLEMYHNDMKVGVIKSSTGISPEILKENAATAWVNGNGVLGTVTAEFSMKLAIKKAKESGIGMVVAKGANHYSIAGHWALMAEQEGLIGMSFTNTSPKTYPTRGSAPSLGTNPISFFAPAEKGDYFGLDMATTTVALGKIEVNQRRGVPIPDGWGTNKVGEVTNDAELCMKEGGLLPLGGTEETGGYKGFGLCMMVEVLCGILGDGKYGSNVRRWGFHGENDEEANLGQCFMAIDPSSFAPGFEGRMSDLMKMHREMEPSPSAKGPVLVAGDPERIHMKETDEQGGIKYHKQIIEHYNKLAENIGVEKIPFDSAE